MEGLLKIGARCRLPRRPAAGALVSGARRLPPDRGDRTPHEAEIDGAGETTLTSRSASTAAIARPNSDASRASDQSRTTYHAKHPRHAIVVRTLEARPTRARLPACDVPEQPLEDLLPASALAPRSPCPARAFRAADHSALRESVDAEHVGRHAFLSAGQLHDEVQPQAERTRRGDAGVRRPASAAARRNAPGHAARALRDAAVSVGDLGPGGVLAAAGGRRPWRVHGAAGGRGVFPRHRPGRAAHAACSCPTTPTARTPPAPSWPASSRSR